MFIISEDSTEAWTRYLFAGSRGWSILKFLAPAEKLPLTFTLPRKSPAKSPLPATTNIPTPAAPELPPMKEPPTPAPVPPVPPVAVTPLPPYESPNGAFGSPLPPVLSIPSVPLPFEPDGALKPVKLPAGLEAEVDTATTPAAASAKNAVPDRKSVV